MSSRVAPAVRTITLTKARNNLGDLVTRVHHNKEYLIFEKDGVPIAGVMDIDEFEDYLELNDPKVRREIMKSNEDIRAGRTRNARDLLAELRDKNKSKVRKTRSKKV
ncbi:MAG TPA: type II toxin-antitoxin system Phd/YefM family antitoxin [Blastocatellia bacterium]|nr:type II toxin-antitoxin system Phd/YefM family antitoxin [Blastocatellia bacterium]